MKLKIFAIRDNATDMYGTPMFPVTTGQAIRSFSDEVNRQADDNMIYKHPNDYDLYELGTYNGNTGTFETDTPARIATGNQVVLKPQ